MTTKAQLVEYQEKLRADRDRLATDNLRLRGELARFQEAAGAYLRAGAYHAACDLTWARANRFSAKSCSCGRDALAALLAPQPVKAGGHHDH